MEVKNLCKAYGDLPVLENVSFTAGVGVTALWGPSGVGKTTLLRILLGLEKPDSGELMGTAVRWSAVFQEDRLQDFYSALMNLRLTLPGVKSDALLRESIPYSLLISFATPPLIIIATVLFAVAQSVRDTSAAMPSWADLFPLIILRSLEISHSIPP